MHVTPLTEFACSQRKPDEESPTRVDYPLQRYRFVEIIQNLLKTPHLSSLSRPNGSRWHPDQRTPYHGRFYRGCAEFLPFYRRLISDVVAPLFNGPFCFQRVPTLRVHLPGYQAVSAYHVDSDYNHQLGEVNFWVPLTEAFDTNTMWIETSKGARDFQPVCMSPGTLLVFDANSLMHGNELNRTGRTRVSFDFRCIPVGGLEDRNQRSVSSGLRLKVGEYFDVYDWAPKR